MRTHYCGQFGPDLIGESVEVCGWVNRRRDHGGVIFLDLRDRDGVVQIVANPEDAEVFATADRVRGEFVLRVCGRVRARPAGTENPALPTGAVEIVAAEIRVLSEADTPPFHPDDAEAGEEVRLRFRHIDLRRAEMQARLRLRAQAARALRAFLDARGFLEIETPALTRATPEGARDYLVPSRVHRGEFYALPQSPQLFKQLLMMGGVDRYYQIARCFRDEDLRADRQPEFTQLDIEASFVVEDDIMRLTEEMMRALFRDALEVELPEPFPRLTYAEAVSRFGVDRPDLRIPLELTEMTPAARGVEFKVFAEPASRPDGRVAALRAPGGARLTRKEIDDYTAFVGNFGARGLAYVKCDRVADGRAGLQSPILKFLPDEFVAALLAESGARDGDILFFGAGDARVVGDSLGALRARIGRVFGLAEDGWRPLWVVDFPMFERDADSGRRIALHHPFTAPAADSPEALRAAPDGCLSRAYDMVINGAEVGGGSVRIHDADMQRAVFDLIGLGADAAEAQFGFLTRALRHGCPPHGGIAFGLDRLVMILSGAASLRDVVAFPKTQTATCLLTGAPAPATREQLTELGLRAAGGGARGEPKADPKAEPKTEQADADGAEDAKHVRTQQVG